MPTRRGPSSPHEGTPTTVVDQACDFMWYRYNSNAVSHYLIKTEKFDDRYAWTYRFNLVFGCGLKRSDRWARRAYHTHVMNFGEGAHVRYCPECLAAYHKERFNKPVVEPILAGLRAEQQTPGRLRWYIPTAQPVNLDQTFEVVTLDDDEDEA